MISETELVKACKNCNKAAQKELYYTFSPKMRGVCLRYTNDKDEAKDILQEGFIKVFSHIEKFSGNGSLEGWIRRIMVNTAISHFKKHKKHSFSSLEDVHEKNIANEQSVDQDDDEGFRISDYSELTQEQLLNSLSILPEQFRVVFNLFFLENFSHKEIAEALSIDENTSRTRLFRGKKMLQKHLQKMYGRKEAVKNAY